MHRTNIMWWADKGRRYPGHFSGDIRVVEFGSQYVNGSIRRHFKGVHPGNYIGIDWRPGKNVDLVSLAHEAPLKSGWYHTVASASMLEHDPYWKKSVSKMVDVMRPDGGLFITWGSARCERHQVHTAPDQDYHALKAELLVREVQNLGVTIQAFEYEVEEGREHGFATLHGWKDPDKLVGEPIFEEYVPEDRV